MGENTCKQCDQQGLNLQNIQTAPAALHPKNKQLNQKMSRGFKQTFLQKRHTDGQKAHEKMPDMANYYRNTNQNHSELSPHTDQKGHLHKIYQ